MEVAGSAVGMILIFLGTLTGVGSVRRGDPLHVAILSAFVFPLSWAAWYVEDNRVGARRPDRGC